MILVNDSTYKYGKTVSKESKSMTLDKICKNMGFHRPVFSHILCSVKLLELTIDNDLKFSNHIKYLVASAKLKSLGKI